MLWEEGREKSALNLSPKARQLPRLPVCHCSLGRATSASARPKMQAPVPCLSPPRGRSCAPCALSPMETTAGYRKAARISSGKCPRGLLCLKQGPSKSLDVSPHTGDTLLLEATTGKDVFGGGHSQSEGNSHKFQVCI